MFEPRAPHAVLNALSVEEARQALLSCCGSARWADAMLGRRPFGSASALKDAAVEIWAGLGREDLLEAFAHHPRIGDGQGDAVAAKLRDTEAWSRAEQARVAEASDDTLQALRAANAAYFARFGYIFIVCATGKSATEMLALLRARLEHAPEQELGIAAAEQAKITLLRLEKVGT